MTVEAILSGFLTNVIAADCNFLNNPLFVTPYCVPSLISSNISVIYVDVLFILYINFRFHFSSLNKKQIFWSCLRWIYVHKHLVPKHSPDCNETLVQIVVKDRCSWSGRVTLKHPILSCLHSFFGGNYFFWVQPELKIFPPVAVASVLWRPSLVCSFPSPCRLAAGGCEEKVPR